MLAIIVHVSSLCWISLYLVPSFASSIPLLLSYFHIFRHSELCSRLQFLIVCQGLCRYLYPLMYLNIVFIWVITLCFAHVSIHHHSQWTSSCSWWCSEGFVCCQSCNRTAIAKFHTQFGQSSRLSLKLGCKLQRNSNHFR